MSGLRAPFSFGRVNTEFLLLCRRGVDLVAEFQGCSEDSLLEAGASPLLAAQLARLQHVYFGRTSNSRKQRLARDAARSRAHDLATLDSIESYTRRMRCFHVAMRSVRYRFTGPCSG